MVSVIIPCYNQAQYLYDAIESCLAQTYKDIEIIVVNDGSPDNASEVAKKYPVILIEQENKGISSARNTGIKQASGEYITCLDADDMFDPFFVEKTFAKDDIIGVWQKEFGDSDRLWKFELEHPTLADFKENNRMNCSSLFKREIWENVGGYDERLQRGLEDWQFWLKAAHAGYTFTIIPEPLFHYRKHGESMISEVRRNYRSIFDEMKSTLPEIYGL